MKFVSLSQLLGCPLFGSNFHLFTVPGFIVSLVGIKKKEEEACWPSQFCWSFLSVANSGSLSQLFSVLTSTREASSPDLQWPQDPQVQALTLLWAMGLRAQEGGLP